jgi:hypothetical protein
MALIKVPGSNDIVVWSAIPVNTDVFTEAMTQLGDVNVLAAIIPDKEHTMAAVDLKKKYPDVFLIGPSGITDKPQLKLDYTFQDHEANRVVPGSSIKPELDNFDFVFLNGHANREVAMVDKTSKTLFEADLLFNIPHNGINKDQYPNSKQNAGFWGFINSRLNPDSRVGRFLHSKLLKKTPENRQGLKALFSLDFNTVVMSHGVVIEQDGKEAFKKAYGSYL